jgi:sulfoxide reductase heme-binding subunit YedZ
VKTLNALLGSRFFKPLVFLACLAPLAWLSVQLWWALSGKDPLALGVDPNRTLLHTTGQDAIVILFATLLITPLRRIFGLNRLQAVRRMIGVWVFVYALAHVMVYLVFNQNCIAWSTCDLAGISDDIMRRPFIMAGLTAFTVLLVLAATSTNWAIRRLKKNWQRLHRLVYLAAMAAVVHYIWIQKSDISVPMRWVYGFGILFAIRIYFAWKKRRPSLSQRASPSGA